MGPTVPGKPLGPEGEGRPARLSSEIICLQGDKGPSQALGCCRGLGPLDGFLFDPRLTF